MGSTIRRRVLVSGMVQGVAFRAYTREMARAIGVTGWVQNLPDGRVEAVVEGEPDRVTRMVDWLRKGPPTSRVAEIRVTEEPPTGEFSGFEIVFSRGYW